MKVINPIDIGVHLPEILAVNLNVFDLRVAIIGDLQIVLIKPKLSLAPLANKLL